MQFILHNNQYCINQTYVLINLNLLLKFKYKLKILNKDIKPLCNGCNSINQFQNSTVSTFCCGFLVTSHMFSAKATIHDLSTLILRTIHQPQSTRYLYKYLFLIQHTCTHSHPLQSHNLTLKKHYGSRTQLSLHQKKFHIITRFERRADVVSLAGL